VCRLVVGYVTTRLCAEGTARYYTTSVYNVNRVVHYATLIVPRG
jgi:hypothetical protein